MQLIGKKAVLIGGAGLIGSFVVEQLLKEDIGEVVVFDNFVRGNEHNIEAALKDSRVKVFEAGGDIRETEILNDAVKGADVAFHFAALWLLQCYEYPRAAFDVNIQGTFNVLEACRNQKVGRLVYSSSASVYGDAVETPMTEAHPFMNRTFYGATKVAGEQMARAFYERYGLDYVGLRYMNVYGPRQDYNGAYVSVIMKILDRIDQGLPPVVFGDGSQTFDFIYVQDVAKANICAAKADATDACYNVGTGKGTTIKEICEMLLKLTGSTLEIEYREEGLSFVTHRIGSEVKAKEELGFVAQTPLEEGLKRLIEWREEDKKRKGVRG